MKRNIKRTLLVSLGVFVVCFPVLQVVFFTKAFSARTAVADYLGREVCRESIDNFEKEFYPNGVGRTTAIIPGFKAKLAMHEASFVWNELLYIPLDENTNVPEVWVGTCTLTPKTPWRQMDIFGLLGPFKVNLYGDWSTRFRKTNSR